MAAEGAPGAPGLTDAIQNAPHAIIAQEKHAAHIAQLTSHSWNIFRYIGDYLHLFGVFMLLGTLIKNRSCQGISKSTQILYFLIFICRYLDLVDHSQTAYLVFFKVTYILTSIIVLLIFWKLHHTYERQKDTCSLAVILVPCFTASILLSNEISFMEMLWTFSQFLEGFAMVPQYIFLLPRPSGQRRRCELVCHVLGWLSCFLRRELDLQEDSDAPLLRHSVLDRWCH